MLKFNVVPRKNPMNKTVKYYAQLKPFTPVRLASFANAISRQCTVTVHDVKAVLSAIEEHICSNLCNGNSVKMGDLGSFRLSVRSTGVSDPEKFSSRLISGTHVIFTPSTNLRYQLSRRNPQLQFQRVSTEDDNVIEDAGDSEGDNNL